MMERLLKLKSAVVEYFRRHSNNSRKLIGRDWLVTNEVCSLLDAVAEVTTKIQGSVDTHISQTMFHMYEIKDILGSDKQKIRTPDQPYPGRDLLKEKIDVAELAPESRKVRSVLLEKLEEKGLGQARLKAERICALLDPRRKSCSADHLVNGGGGVQFAAELDVKAVADTFVELEGGVGETKGGEGSGSGEPAREPAAKKPKIMSDLEERRLERLAKSKAAEGAAWRGLPGTRLSLFQRELRAYLAEDEQAEENNFSLLEFWEGKTRAVTCATTGETQGPMPHLALIARLYHGIESTSCQAERNFSAFAHLLGPLRNSTLPGKVESMMFLRLNKSCIKEVRDLHSAVAQNKTAAEECAGRVADVEAAAANSVVTLLQNL